MALAPALIAGLAGLVAGVALQLRQPDLSAPWPLWWGLVAWGVLWVAHAVTPPVASGRHRLWRGPHAQRALLLGLVGLMAALAGHETTRWRASAVLAQRLAPELEGQDLVLLGTIASLPAERRDGVRFMFEVEQAQHRGQALQPGRDVPVRLSLGWYVPPGDGAERPPSLRAGDRWRWSARLRSPHGLMNPHGFDLELRLFQQGVRASGSVRPTVAPPQWLGDSGRHRIDRWRQQVRTHLQRHLGDTPAAGVLAGLAVGDQSAVDRADWDTFRTTGTAHLLAVSGLHITLLAWAAGGVIRRVWRWSHRAMWACPAQDAARWGGLVAAAGYAVMAGGAVPAQRTVLMLVVLTLLRAGGQRWPGPLILLACAAAVVLFDPWALLQPGFWLSFVAVGLLMLSDAAGAPPNAPGHWLAWSGHPGGAGDGPDAPAAGPRWRHVGAAVAPAARGWWRGQWVASVGLAPWTLLFFQQVSVVGLLANALAVPVLTLGVTPLALAGVLWAPLWTPAAWAIEALMQVLSLMATWPAAEAFAPVAPPLAQALALAGALLVVVPLPWPLRLLGPCLMLPMLWPAVERPAAGEFDVLAADVGQGNAVLVRTATRHLLYDTGPVYSPESDAGERVLVPLLRAWGSGRLDLLVLSHRDSDHTGGAAAVLRQPGAARMLGSLEQGHPLRRLAPFQPCAAGQRWDWDGVRFEVLHPRAESGHTGHRGPAGDPGAQHSNAASCVLRVSNGRRVLLLTGDIERDQEADILRRALEAGDPHRLQADVMLVPHHGSRTSSSPAWLRAVKPRWGLVQSGHHNRYGHPAPEVLARLRSHDIGLIRTDQCGAWHWRSADASSECSRQTGRRYWHAPTWPSTD